MYPVCLFLMIAITYTFTQSDSSSGLFNRLYATQEMNSKVFRRCTKLTMFEDISNSTYKRLIRKLNNRKWDREQ